MDIFHDGIPRSDAVWRASDVPRKVLAQSSIYARKSIAVMFFIISNYKKKDYVNLTNII